jgi:CRISPR/Cas system-associated endonuclease Cas3-HD
MDTIPQGNSNHSLTLGHHCRAAKQPISHCSLIANDIEKGEQSLYNLKIAAMLHDIGKIATKVRGQDGQCHYYRHNCVGAYESMFYLNDKDCDLPLEDKLYISNLIYYHAKPLNSWSKSEKSFNSDRRVLGEDMLQDIMLLHNADLVAHNDSNMEIDKNLY